jgi:hypothetical protein
VTVIAEMQDGTQVDDDPKSEAAKRTTSLPAALQTDVETHLSQFAQAGPSGRVFIGPEGCRCRAARPRPPKCAG